MHKKGQGEMTNKTLTNEQFHVSTTFDGDLTTTTIYSMEVGARATGHARRHPTDLYDEEFGESLSAWRAMERLARKMVRLQIRELAND